MREEEVASEARAYLSSAEPISEMRMFGGDCFFLNGNMLAAVSKRGLLVRVGKDREAEALSRLGARRMEMRGRPMAGYVRVDMQGLAGGALQAWLDEAKAFVKTLPPKLASKPARKRSTSGPRELQG
jgi:TfoX/Sxy family transcriptional regulator of competence genes